MVRELGSTERHKGYYAQLRSSGGVMGFLRLRDLGSKERHNATLQCIISTILSRLLSGLL